MEKWIRIIKIDMDLGVHDRCNKRIIMFDDFAAYFNAWTAAMRESKKPTNSSEEFSRMKVKLVSLRLVCAAQQII